MLRLLVAILIRQANSNSPGNPTSWLESLQATKWSDVNSQNGQITGTTVNGKSITLMALPGCSVADLLSATELALQTLEAGLIAPPSRTQAVLSR